MGLLGPTFSILLVTLLSSIGFGMSSSVSAADVEIVVKQKAFTPQQIKIKAGDSVTWTNKDQEDHFLTSAGGLDIEVVPGTEFLLIHKLLHPDDSYKYTFTKPDTYHYFCAIHMQMWGTVAVEK